MFARRRALLLVLYFSAVLRAADTQTAEGHRQDVDGDGKKEVGKDHNRDGKLEFRHDVDGDGKKELGKDKDGDGEVEFGGKQAAHHSSSRPDTTSSNTSACSLSEEHAVDLASGCSKKVQIIAEEVAEHVAGENHTASVDAAERFFQALGASFMVILATEVGDKTFFIAAILAMSYSRFVVWAGAIGALAVMTVLAVVLGWLAPLLLPPVLTHYAAIALFIFFGGRMLYDAKGASSEVSDELAEVEEELQGKAGGHEPVPTAEQDPEADAEAAEGEAAEGGPARGPGPGGRPTALTIAIKAFTLTFVAEWGDRSQIATIALAADHEPFGVTLGGVIGHSLCTGVAVIGGKLLASRISERTVLLSGGVLFLLFAIAELIHGAAES